MSPQAAHLIDTREAAALDVLGASVQLLDPPTDERHDPRVMRGVIPPHAVVPLHSHSDPETFVGVSGQLEGLSATDDGFRWIPIGPGDVFHVPGNARHAFRNPSDEPAVSIVIITGQLSDFFEETGKPLPAGATTTWPPAPEEVEGFLEIAARYGYWNASPEENAAAGLQLPH